MTLGVMRRDLSREEVIAEWQNRLRRVSELRRRLLRIALWGLCGLVILAALAWALLPQPAHAWVLLVLIAVFGLFGFTWSDMRVTSHLSCPRCGLDPKGVGPHWPIQAHKLTDCDYCLAALK